MSPVKKVLQQEGRSQPVRCLDCRDGLVDLPEASIDYVVTDPPYGLKFMGKGWDRGVPGAEFWEAILRVVKPGSMMLTFGGARMHHRLMCAIEDAGWEIRDCLMWLYGGANLAKSRNFGKRLQGEWIGWSTALKPAWEPIILSMKTREGTFAENALAYGVAGLNIDGARVRIDDGERARIDSRSGVGWGTGNSVGGHRGRSSGRFKSHPKGRLPTNVILDKEAGALLDDQQGAKKFGEAGASRFFYCAKASKSERNAGLPPGMENKHPTVKPLKLLTYLLTLLSSPVGGTVLDPFAGSGSIGVACAQVGRKFIGFEIEQGSCDIANARIRAVRGS